METRLSRPREHLLPAVLAAALLWGTVVAIAEIAAEPTPVEGVLSSSWTPLRGTWSVIAGADSFGGSFQVAGVLLGSVVLVGAAVVAGVAGSALIVWLLGAAPPPVIAAGFGAFWGLLVQIVVVMLLVAGLLDGRLMYEAMPRWGWWLGLTTWGIALALLGARAEPGEQMGPVHGERSPT